MGQSAAELHEMFTSCLQAGFSRKEALYLVGQYLTAVVTVLHSPPGDDAR